MGIGQFMVLGCLVCALACTTEPPSHGDDDGLSYPATEDESTEASPSGNTGTVQFEGLELNQISAVGFSPQEAADTLAGEYEAVLDYQDSSSETQLTVSVDPTFEHLGQGVDYNIGDEVAAIVTFDTPEVWFKAELTLRTNDGSLDERVTGIVRATAVDRAYCRVQVELEAVNGGYQSSLAGSPDPEAPTGGGALDFGIDLMPSRATEGTMHDTRMRALVATWAAGE